LNSRWILVPKLRLGNALAGKAPALRIPASAELALIIITSGIHTWAEIESPFPIEFSLDSRSQAPAWERTCRQSSGFAYFIRKKSLPPNLP
jgi:hypothetical protein